MAADPRPGSERRLRVMGSDAHIVLDGDPRLLDVAQRRLAELEARWSRFLPTSEISRLNGSAGALTVVSAETYRLVSLAVDAWRATSGRFDPTVLGDVIRAGYDCSFEQLNARRAHAPLSGLSRGAGGIVLMPSVSAVALPPGIAIDPGGIGKGLAADLLAEELIAAGAAGVCVNVGGDLRVGGTWGGEEAWLVAVDPADDGHPVAYVELGAGAVATTTRRRRTWTIAGSEYHHVIDPSTGAPSDAGVASIAVLAGECWWAEVLAKAAFVAGAVDALSVIDEAGAAGLVVDRDGRARHSSGLARYLAGGCLLAAGDRVRGTR